METLRRSTPKANKDHRCDWCLQTIAKGERYESQTNKFDGVVYTWKNHINCNKIAQELRMFDECNEGVNEENFHETIDEEYRQIMSRTQNELYESKDFVEPKFKDRLEFVMIHHGILRP